MKQATMKLANLMESFKHDYLIVNFNKVMFTQNDKRYYDLRLLKIDSSELQRAYLDPIREWKHHIERN
jgi:hypothetical protein